MNINFIDLKDIVSPKSNHEDLLKCFKKYLKGSTDSSKRWDILCSLFRQRKYLKLKNEELFKFFNKFKPKVYCVYKLYFKGVCVYVGSSYDITTRITSHFKDKCFDFVEVCIKETKEEMLCLEHKLIDEIKPSYNKSSNLKYVANYSGEMKEEVFIDLEDLIVELPIRKNGSNKLYSLFKGQSFKYPYGKLNTNSKHKIAGYFVRESNEEFPWYEKTESKLGPQYQEQKVTWNLKDKLIELGYKDMIEFGKPVQNCITFDNKYVITSSKWRVVGNSKWYSIKDKEHLLTMIVDYVSGKYGEYTLKEDKIFTFGKYKNKTINFVLENDPKYIDWCVTNLPSRTVRNMGLLSLTESITFENAFERLNKKD